MVRFHFRELLAGTCSLALQFQPKTAPPRVGYALSKVMVLEHVLDFQVFYSHFIATFKDAMRHLKLEILALIRYPFMGTGDNLALFRSTSAAFFAPRQYPLMFAECLFRLAIVAWVRNAFAIRINDKRVQSNIHPQRGINGNFHRGWHLNDDCGIPTGRLLGDGQRLNFAVGQRSVVSNLQASDFGDNYTSVLPIDIANQSLCQVAERHRPIPSLALEAWKARFLTRFDTTEECFVCFIQAAHGILKHVAVEAGKCLRFLLKI